MLSTTWILSTLLGQIHNTGLLYLSCISTSQIFRDRPEIWLQTIIIHKQKLTQVGCIQSLELLEAVLPPIDRLHSFWKDTI